MAGQAQATSLIGGGDEAEEQLRRGLVERSKADLVNQDHVVAQQAVNDAVDGVVRQSAVKLLDQVGGRGVAHAQAVFDGSQSDADQHMALAGARGTNEQ